MQFCLYEHLRDIELTMVPSPRERQMEKAYHDSLRTAACASVQRKRKEKYCFMLGVFCSRSLGISVPGLFPLSNEIHEKKRKNKDYGARLA